MHADSKDAGGILNAHIPSIMIRTATVADLESLIAIEKSAFELDRFSRRTFRYLLSKANAETLIAEEQGKV